MCDLLPPPPVALTAARGNPEARSATNSSLAKAREIAYDERDQDMASDDDELADALDELEDARAEVERLEILVARLSKS